MQKVAPGSDNEGGPPPDEAADLWERVTGEPIPDRERRIVALITEAADLWVLAVGDEGYIPGQTPMSTMRFAWLAESIWSRAHEAQFPERWTR